MYFTDISNALESTKDYQVFRPAGTGFNPRNLPASFPSQHSGVQAPVADPPRRSGKCGESLANPHPLRLKV
jgi:hypothetical protein